MKVLTYGEMLLRLRAPLHERLLQSNYLETTVGGSEANVAISLANYGMDASYLSIVPDNALARHGIGELRRYGVNTDKVIYKPGRLGLYFIEDGSGYLPSKVVYDRAYSAMSLAGPSDIDWDAVLEGIDLLHISGITLSLSESLTELSLEGIREAKKRDIQVSCDLNYRKNLWKYGADPKKVMAECLNNTDIIIANDEDIFCTTGIEVGPDEKLTCETIQKAFPNVRVIAMNNVKNNKDGSLGWYAGVYSKGEYYASRVYEIYNYVDRVGGGDAFAAALLYGLDYYDGLKDAVEFATAASCLKFSIVGDYNRISVSDAENLIASGENSSLQR